MKHKIDKVKLSKLSGFSLMVLAEIQKWRTSTIQDLADNLMVSRRRIKLATEEIREAGIPLCTSTREPYGCFIARNAEEFEPYKKTVISMMKKMAMHLNAMSKSFEN